MDGNILLWIQENLRFEWLTPIMKFITTLGNAGIFWIVLTILLLFLPKYRRAGIACAIALLFSVLIVNGIIKVAVDRTRPYEVIDGLVLLTKKATDASFPSGHTSSSFASATSIFLMGYKKEGVIALILAGLIAYSRLYIGIHYPTDVLAGLALGVLFAFAAKQILKLKPFSKISYL